jgi:hypothetical protein
MQSQLYRKDYAEITKILQKAVDDLTTTGPAPMIKGFQILKTNDIHFSCNSEQEAQHLRNINWSMTPTGLEVVQDCVVEMPPYSASH